MLRLGTGNGAQKNELEFCRGILDTAKPALRLLRCVATVTGLPLPVGLNRGMYFTIESEIVDVEMIASGRGVRSRDQLRKKYGSGCWRKMKGIADVQLPGGDIRRAEIYSYEAHGIGKKNFKIKRFLD